MGKRTHGYPNDGYIGGAGGGIQPLPEQEPTLPTGEGPDTSFDVPDPNNAIPPEVESRRSTAARESIKRRIRDTSGRVR